MSSSYKQQQFRNTDYRQHNDSCQEQDPSKGDELVGGMPNFGFGGVPETLIINAIIFLIVLVAFIIMKKIGSAVDSLNVFDANKPITDIGSTTQIFYSPPEANPQIDRIGKNTPEEDHLVRKGAGTLSWITVLFRLRDRHFFKRAGQDAVDYLRFSRLLITLMGFIMVMGLAVILPVNMTGTLRRRYDSFGATTIANLRPHSNLMWIHVALVLLLVPITFIAIKSILRLQLKLSSSNERRLAPYKTLMISNLPEDGGLNEEIIRRHFSETYPKAPIVRVDFSFDSERLLGAVREKMYTDYCVHYVERWRQQHPRQDLTVHTAHCACCCCGSGGVEAAQFYDTEARDAGARMEREHSRAVEAPTRVVFVTFESHEDARRVLDDFTVTQMCAGRRYGRDTSVSDQLQVSTWSVMWAPLPFYVNWQKLSTSGARWWLRAILINVGLVTLVVFLTTPALVLNFLQKNVLQNIPIATQWLPTILLMIVTFLFLFIIQASVHWQGYYSKRDEVFIQLRNLYIYLLLILLILPSLGLTSAEALWNFFHSQSDSGGDPRAAAVNWQCVFLPSSGSFFVNFILAAALFGNGMALLRLGGLISFCVKRCWARSDAERAALNRQRAAFAYPASYAALLVIYSIAVVYSFICPIILPCAFLFFVVRHYVDKFNLYYSITPLDNRSRLSMGMHARACTYLFVPLFLQNLVMLAFSLLRGVQTPVVAVFAASTAALLIYVLVQGFSVVHWVDGELVRAIRHFLTGSEDGEKGARRKYSHQMQLTEQQHEAKQQQQSDTERMHAYEDPAFVQYEKIKSGAYNVDDLEEPEVSGVNVSSMPPIPT